MNVDGAALVPAGVDRRELRDAGCIRRLVSAQPLLALRVEARVGRIAVDAERVAVPHVHRRALERGTRSAGHSPDLDREVETGAVLRGPAEGVRADVGPVQLLVD